MSSANEFQKNVYHWWFWMSIHIKMLFLNISLRGIEDCICVNESTLTKQIWTKMDIFCKWTAKGVNKFPRAPMKKSQLRWNLTEATENLKKQKYWLDCGNRRTCFEVASKFRWYNKRKKIIFFSTTQFRRQKLLRKPSRLFDSAPINNTLMYIFQLFGVSLCLETPQLSQKALSGAVWRISSCLFVIQS